MSAAKKEEYTAKSIKSLSQHNHLLKRLPLTFGRETGDAEHPFSSQKTVAIREIIDNAVDEVKSGYGDQISVSYFKDNSFEVIDTGRGLPVDIGVDSNGQKCSGVYLTLGVIQSGGKFSTDSKRFSGGQNGVGGSSTNHTAERLDCTVYRNNKKYELSFKDGTPGFFDKENDPKAKFTELTDYTYLKESEDDRTSDVRKKYPTGTSIRVWLRDSVYSSKYPVDTLDLTERLRGTAFLLPGVIINVYDEINLIIDDATGKEIPRIDRFQFEGGIPDLVEANMNAPQIGEKFYFKTKTRFLEENVAVLEGNNVVNKDVMREVEIEVAFAWEANWDYNIESYVNSIRTRLGGVHEVAFEKSLTSAFGARLNSIQGLMKRGDPELKFDDFSEGLIAVLSINVSEPEFTAQAKEELGGKALQKALIKEMTSIFEKFANNNKNTDKLKVIGEKVVQAARNRQAATDQKALNRKKNAIESSRDMPEKLTDCEIIGDENSELYIIEGDSAKSALKQGRVSGKYQALLAIRGKTVNALNSPLTKVLANKEVQDMIKALGAGSGSSFDIEKSRYGRVFIATDADADGGDIAALVISIFWVLFRPIIEAGCLYQLCTPLYVVYEGSGKNEKRHYINEESELKQVTDQLTEEGKKWKIQRLKGLGEGSTEVTEETAMNPLTRTVRRVILTERNKKQAEEMFETIFGSDTSRRKEWIATNPIDDLEILD